MLKTDFLRSLCFTFTFFLIDLLSKSGNEKSHDDDEI